MIDIIDHSLFSTCIQRVFLPFKISVRLSKVHLLSTPFWGGEGNRANSQPVCGESFCRSVFLGVSLGFTSCSTPFRVLSRELPLNSCVWRVFHLWNISGRPERRYRCYRYRNLKTRSDRINKAWQTYNNMLTFICNKKESTEFVLEGKNNVAFWKERFFILQYFPFKVRKPDNDVLFSNAC